jgi:hypothetical protein
MATYRRPVPADLPQLMRLSKEMHGETSFQSLSFSPSKTATELMSFIVNPDLFMLVAEQEGEIVGMVAAFLSEPYFSDDLAVYDHVWFVSKAARGSMVGPRLLNYLTEWGRLCKAKTIFVTLGSDVDQDRVGKLVERLGYDRLGGYYRKDIDRG